jgi:hypothetical protein
MIWENNKTLLYTHITNKTVNWYPGGPVEVLSRSCRSNESFVDLIYNQKPTSQKKYKQIFD